MAHVDIFVPNNLSSESKMPVNSQKKTLKICRINPRTQSINYTLNLYTWEKPKSCVGIPGTSHLIILNQMLQSSMDNASQNRWTMTRHIIQNLMLSNCAMYFTGGEDPYLAEYQQLRHEVTTDWCVLSSGVDAVALHISQSQADLYRWAGVLVHIQVCMCHCFFSSYMDPKYI